MQNFKVIIAGSREFNNYNFLKNKIDKILSSKKQEFNIIIISGTAKGADSLGEKYAKENNYQIERFPADWNKFGRSAGYKRNKQMAENSDAAIVFWDGKSKGSKHMIEICQEQKKPFRIIKF